MPFFSVYDEKKAVSGNHNLHRLPFPVLKGALHPHQGRNIGIALLAGFGIGILYLLDITKEYRQIRKNVKFKDSKARKVQKYHKFTVLLQSVYAVCNLLLSFWGGWLVVGIIPITLHFMVSYAVTANMDDRLQCNQEEWTAIEFWRAMGVVSYVAAFCSMLIVSAVVS